MLQSSASPHPIYTGKTPAYELTRTKQFHSPIHNSKVTARVLCSLLGAVFQEGRKQAGENSKD